MLRNAKPDASALVACSPPPQTFRKARAMTHVRSAPPFRADHVGSLLRPAYLLEARNARANGTLTAAALREVEDRSIVEAIQLQEEVGLQSVTDGEHRRTYFHID